jgi:hypothetical protein
LVCWILLFSVVADLEFHPSPQGCKEDLCRQVNLWPYTRITYTTARDCHYFWDGGCSSEGFRLRLLCSRNSSVGSSCSDWRESCISLWMAAYRRSMPVKSVNSTLPSGCLHSTVLSASALVKSFHTALFPFKRGEFWIICPI